MRAITKICAWMLAVGANSAQAVPVNGVRLWTGPEGTRVVFDLASHAEHRLFVLEAPDRVVVDLEQGEWAAAEAQPNGVVRAIRHGTREGGGLRIVIDLSAAVQPRSFLVAPNDVYGHRLVLDLAPAQAVPPAAVRSLRAEGERDVVIAIDAGHGGEDPGAIGRGGIREKDVALAIARELADLVERQPDMRAALVRSGDYSVSLRRRIEIAREQRADLFVSIHADAFRDPRARGASVYALSERGASSEAARWLAERENAADLIGGVSLDDKDDLLASVLLDLSQTATLSASLQAGAQVLAELNRIGAVRRSDVQQAGFLVLKSPDIPSILIETAYISNPTEEKRLADPAEQRHLASAVLAGVRNYLLANAPPGTRLATSAAARRPLRYNVVPGDTLADIADRFQVSVGALRSENALGSDGIQSGQVLTIPVVR